MDLTIRNLLSTLQTSVIKLYERKGREQLGPPLQQSEIEEYIQQMGDISQSFKRCFNSAAPINQLPVEVLTNIFATIQVHRSSRFPHPFAMRVFHFHKAKDAFAWIQPTMHVCHYWRQVVLSSWSLWNDIHFDVKPFGKEDERYYPPLLIIPRSHPAPLHITVNGIGSDPTELYDALRTITDRIETFQIGWDGLPAKMMLNALRHPFPRLTSLTLRIEMGGMGDSTQVSIPEMLFGNELLQLRRLSLWFYTRWSHHKAPNLTHLSLHRQVFRPSIGEFLDLLQSTPRLEFLLLCRAGPRIARKDLLPQRTVSLPSLRCVQFWTDSSTEIYNVRILKCLTTPQLTRCSILSNTMSSISPGIVSKIIPRINFTEKPLTELSVYLHTRSSYGLEVDAMTRRISIQTNPSSSGTVTMPLRSTITHLHLVNGIPPVNWGGFPTLLSITCYNSLDGIQALVRSLASADSGMEDESSGTDDECSEIADEDSEMEDGDSEMEDEDSEMENINERPKVEDGCPCPSLETIHLLVGEKLPDVMRLNNPRDRKLLQGVLGCFPDHMVVHRDGGNSYQIALELRPALSEQFQIEHSSTFLLAL